MTQDIFIGLVVATVLAVILGIKSLVHRVITFKMDESAIVNFVTESDEKYEFRSTEAISVGTDISTTRVAMVCSKSKLIKRNSKEKESWCVK